MIRYDEKPEIVSPVSMGIYVFEPRALAHIPDKYFDFPDLVHALLAAGEEVHAYPHSGHWFDIGNRLDRARAAVAEAPGRPVGGAVSPIKP